MGNKAPLESLVEPHKPFGAKHKPFFFPSLLSLEPSKSQLPSLKGKALVHPALTWCKAPIQCSGTCSFPRCPHSSTVLTKRAIFIPITDSRCQSSGAQQPWVRSQWGQPRMKIITPPGTCPWGMAFYPHLAGTNHKPQLLQLLPHVLWQPLPRRTDLIMSVGACRQLPALLCLLLSPSQRQPSSLSRRMPGCSPVHRHHASNCHISSVSYSQLCKTWPYFWPSSVLAKLGCCSRPSFLHLYWPSYI